jgi:hypothetical protein
MNLLPTPILRQVAVVLDIGQQAVSQNVPGSKNLNTADAGFGNLMSGLLSNVMMLGAILCFAFLIWGAIDWIVSGGDKSKAEAARNKMTQGVVGLIVLASTTAVFRVVQGFLGLCFLKIAGKC